MKIGVITYWAGNSNYGMMLQCWALQKFLKDLGHAPYIIRYIKRNNQSLYRRILELVGALRIYRQIKCLLFHQKFIDTNKNNTFRQFDSFRLKYLTFSDVTYNTIRDLQLNPPIADCYITGSDQVWSQLLNDIDNTAYFLNFGKSDTKKISYAPSFSMIEYPRELSDKLIEMLSQLDHISVREYNGVDICERLGFKAKKVLDPTLLLEKSDYLHLCDDIETYNDRFIFIYSLNLVSSDDIRWEELKELGEQEHFKCLVTPSDGYILGGEIFDQDVTYCYATVEKWLAMIRDSQFTVTSSFHGVALSIILEKPFVYIPLKGKYSSGNNRVLDLLEELHLENRILYRENTYSAIIEQEIDWATTKSLLQTYRSSSVSFLINALNCNK